MSANPPDLSDLPRLNPVCSSHSKRTILTNCNRKSSEKTMLASLPSSLRTSKTSSSLSACLQRLTRNLLLLVDLLAL